MSHRTELNMICIISLFIHTYAQQDFFTCATSRNDVKMQNIPGDPLLIRSAETECTTASAPGGVILQDNNIEKYRIPYDEQHWVGYYNGMWGHSLEASAVKVPQPTPDIQVTVDTGESTYKANQLPPNPVKHYQDTADVTVVFQSHTIWNSNSYLDKINPRTSSDSRKRYYLNTNWKIKTSGLQDLTFDITTTGINFPYACTDYTCTTDSYLQFSYFENKCEQNTCVRIRGHPTAWHVYEHGSNVNHHFISHGNAVAEQYYQTGDTADARWFPMWDLLKHPCDDSSCTEQRWRLRIFGFTARIGEAEGLGDNDQRQEAEAMWIKLYYNEETKDYNLKSGFNIQLTGTQSTESQSRCRLRFNHMYGWNNGAAPPGVTCLSDTHCYGLAVRPTTELHTSVCAVMGAVPSQQGSYAVHNTYKQNGNFYETSTHDNTNVYVDKYHIYI